ncbi:glycosyltransferase [Erythrobacter sp. Alg231-14]|uniref:glycosyltransferase n=1 Tax=Erythrobacter sp. Alg231-14 TaxID=1922225 RepID=UPI000D54E641
MQQRPPSDAVDQSGRHASSDVDPILGVAIAAFKSEDIIAGCLDSLLACKSDVERVVITDNDSPDNTRATIRQWAKENSEAVTFEEGDVGSLTGSKSWLVLLNSDVNGGFAYATNRSIEVLQADPAINLFWVLNPDCRAARDTASQYIEQGRDQNFSLMGGRTVFEEHRDMVQTDGGRVSRWTGVCASVNWGEKIKTAKFPPNNSLDFITGANCVASRRFLDEVGLMEEDYFLYYEEVDWAFRRKNLPLKTVPSATVWHYGGTAIGTGSVGRRPSPFSNYFNYRNRIRFMKRFNRMGLPVALIFASLKAVQLVLLGAGKEARALIAGMLGMAPPSDVAEILSPDAQQVAFGKDK